MAHKTADEIMKIYGEKPVFTSKIAFVSDRDGNDELYMMDYDGANQTRLTFNKVMDDIARPGRPTANCIAYTSYQNLTRRALHSQDLRGPKRIAGFAQGRELFARPGLPTERSWPSARPMDGNAEIYVADIDEDSLNRGRSASSA